MSQPLLPKTAFNAVNQKFWEETSGSESDCSDAEDIVPGALPEVEEVPVAHIAADEVSDAEEEEEQLSDQLGEEDDHLGEDERDDADASHSSSAGEVSGVQYQNFLGDWQCP